MTADASQLHHLGADLSRTAGGVGAKAAAAVKKTAFAIERDAKTKAPVDTGFLQNSISTTITGDGRFSSIAAEVGPTAEYGIFVEQGTSLMAAQPYLGPAFDRNLPPFEQAMGQLGGRIS